MVYSGSMSGSRRLGLLVAIFSGSLLTAAATASADNAASTSMAQINSLFLIVSLMALGIGVFVGVILLLAVWKFRIRRGHQKPTENLKTYNHKIEAAWTIIPALILLLIGVMAFETLAFTDTVPQHYDVTVTAIGHQWFWEFWTNYTSGPSLHSFGNLTLKSNLTVRLIVVSVDVAHSFFIPEMGVHIDAIPSHQNVGWFKPTMPGQYHIECTQFCGLNHYTMVGTLVVTP